MARCEPLILVGGSGFIGTAITPLLLQDGRQVVIIDRLRPRCDAHPALRWVPCDLLTDDLAGDGALPPGHVVLLAGNGDPRPRWTWTLPLDIAVTTARLLPALRNRDVTLVSSVEVYGFAAPPLTESTTPALPMIIAELQSWCADARLAATGLCPPWRVAALCRRLADVDPSGRWVYALSKLAQELLVQSAVVEADLCILRLANVFGAAQERVVTRLVRSALCQRPIEPTASVRHSFLAVEDVARLLLRPMGPGIFNIGHQPISLVQLARMVGEACGAPVPTSRPTPAPVSDSCGLIDTSRATKAGMELRPMTEALRELVRQMRKEPQRPLFEPALPVVIPPRPAKPDEVADRQQAALWSGLVKHGNRWSTELTERLRETLELGPDDELLVTKSGTYALRLALAATVGHAQPGELAILPSFTHRATADVLVQFGYGLRYVDIDAWSWTLDPKAVEVALRDENVRLVMCVDTFGNPCFYPALRQVCANHGVTLIADSAAALGSSHAGHAVGRQADAHAFSMSFAKALTAAGAGGAVVLKAGARKRDPFAWLSSSLIDELHAVAALDQLDTLAELVSRRNRVARLYEATAARLERVACQGVSPENVHSYVHWVLAVPEREELARRLAHFGVQTKPYFPAQHLRYEVPAPWHRLPVTERLDREALALPMSSELSEAQAESVALALHDAAACLGNPHG
jgi:dTDP-4-amino-4,6-dideoxygalactose transaminase/nucleoside-diphosphate-sugar epimerase